MMTEPSRVCTAQPARKEPTNKTANIRRISTILVDDKAGIVESCGVGRDHTV